MEGTSIWSYFTPSSRTTLEEGLRWVLGRHESDHSARVEVEGNGKASAEEGEQGWKHPSNQFKQLQALREDGAKGEKVRGGETSEASQDKELLFR